MTTGQRRRLPSFCWSQYTPACLIFRVYRKPILKLACGCTRLLSYFPSPSYWCRVLADGGIQLGHLSRAGSLMTKPSVRCEAGSRQSFGL